MTNRIVQRIQIEDIRQIPLDLVRNMWFSESSKGEQDEYPRQAYIDFDLVRFLPDRTFTTVKVTSIWDGNEDIVRWSQLTNVDFNLACEQFRRRGLIGWVGSLFRKLEDAGV